MCSWFHIAFLGNSSPFQYMNFAFCLRSTSMSSVYLKMFSNATRKLVGSVFGWLDGLLVILYFGHVTFI